MPIANGLTPAERAIQGQLVSPKMQKNQENREFFAFRLF
jgi:hypothetical protein